MPYQTMHNNNPLRRQPPSPTPSSPTDTNHHKQTLITRAIPNGHQPQLYLVLLAVISIGCSLLTINNIAKSPDDHTTTAIPTQPSNLLTIATPLNHLSFRASPPDDKLKIALFVKRWPQANVAGGMERHALTLHLFLARRGHETHIFTTNSSATTPPPEFPDARVHFHVTPPANGRINQTLAWEQFVLVNSTGRPFDVVHTESVGLFHLFARNVSAPLAASWHGIAYEAIHSDIIQELVREPNETRRVTDWVASVANEVKFFQNYKHHVATSHHVGDVLQRVYMIPEGRVHVILNGVDEEIFRPNASKARAFLHEVGVGEPDNSTVIMGLAGRLVRDKGHPIMFEALRQLLEEDEGFRRDIVVLVAGDGPWSGRYRSLGANVVALGSLNRTQLAKFYSCLDVFVHPTLRTQALDQTVLEAMMSGVPVMVTIAGSGAEVVGKEMGETFVPTVESLKGALRRVWKGGKGELKRKGEAARERAFNFLTATKMGLSYERLFLCLGRGGSYCVYPMAGDLL